VCAPTPQCECSLELFLDHSVSISFFLCVVLFYPLSCTEHEFYFFAALFNQEKKLEWGKGLAQKREVETRLEELELEKDKPFARTR